MRLAKYALPLLIIATPAAPALASNAATVSGKYLAGAIVTEIVSPIVADQIMQVMGLAGGDPVDYDEIRSIVEEVVADENRKQTMGRLLGELGGVDKTITDITGYVRADKDVTLEPSSNDTKISEGISAIWQPLNNVLSEFEGQFTGESHELLEPYMMASHLKMSLAGLQMSRAHLELKAFEKMLSSAGKKKAKELELLIEDRKQVMGGHAGVYVQQAVAASNFIHALTLNDRTSMAEKYDDKYISKCVASPLKKGPAFFQDTAKYDPYASDGGLDNPFGGVRYLLRNTVNKNAFPKAVSGSSMAAATIKALKESEETMKADSKSKCNSFRDAYRKRMLPVAVFYQTEQRFGVREIYDVLDAQNAAAKKLATTYRLRMPSLTNGPMTVNRKIAITYKHPRAR